jgi:multicomponent Na+:H+ antiporter subunit D
MDAFPGTSAPGVQAALAAPFIAAAVAGLLGRRRPAAFAVLVGLLVAAAIAAGIAATTLRGWRFDAALGPGGDWIVEFDAFTAGALALVFLLGAAIAASGTARAAAHERLDAQSPGPAEPVALVVSCGLSGLAVCISDMTLAAICAGAAAIIALAAGSVAAGRDVRALQANFEALAAIILAACIGMIGAGIAASAVGPHFEHLRNVTEILSPRALQGGLAVVFAGLAALAALAPSHTWFAPAMARGRTFALYVPTAASLVLMIRFAGAVLQTGDAFLPWMACIALAAIGGASVAVGSAQALAARDGGRLFAHLATIQAGFVALAFGLGTPEGAAAAVLQALCAALALAALAAAATALGQRGDIDGLGARAPFSAAAMTAALLSLLGAPLTAGFAGKWRLAAAALERGWYWAAWIAAAAALAGVVYTARALERIWLRPSHETAPRAAAARTIACVAGLSCILLGFDARGVERMVGISAAAVQGALR